MSEQWYLRLGRSGDRGTLVALNADGQLLHGPVDLPLAEVAARTGSQAVTVLLPASEIVSHLAELPTSSPSRIRQMLPFSLEDEFAGDVDELQFAAGERNAAGEMAVSVIARARLDDCLARLREAGIEAKRIVSEADGVADTPGVTTLVLDESLLLGRRPGGAPFAFEDLSLAQVWQLLRDERDDAGDLADVVLFGDPAALDARRAEIDAWRGELDNLNLRELADGSLPRLAATLGFSAPPNLLQGDYAARADYLGMLRPWRVAAALVLSVIAVLAVGTVAEAIKLGRAEEALTAEIASLCGSSYGSQQELACRRELQRRLAGAGAAGGAGGGFLPMLAAVAAAGGDAISIEQLNYRDGVFTLELVAPSVARLDALDQQISGADGFDAQITSNTPEDGGRYRARVRIVSTNR